MNTAPRILGIDDSLTIRKLLELSLGRSGYELELAATGADGIAHAKRNRPDLILLDYILPDMKGIDVCRALEQDSSTCSVPVILMSAKADDVRLLFKDHAAVVEFIAKPFTPPAITFLVGEWFAKRRPGGDSSTTRQAIAVAGGPGYAAKEAAAKALFAQLKERFARIPEWMEHIKDASPAIYFARKILTPDCLDRLLTALAPSFTTAMPAAENILGDAPPLAGTTALLPVPRLLELVESWGRTGLVSLTQGEVVTTVYVQRGEALLATRTGREDSALRAAIPGITHDALMRQAIAEQERSGKPVAVTMAEHGRIRLDELPALLHNLGRRALLDAINGGPGIFFWRDLSTLPDWIERYGRRFILDQLRLERMREVDDWSQIEGEVPSLELIFHRCPGFAARLGRFALDDQERRVLTLVNGRRTVQQLIEKSSLPTFSVFHVLFRLGQVELVRRSDPAATVEADEAARPVLILDQDHEGVVRTLERLLSRRRRPVPVVTVKRADEVLDAIQRHRPQMALIDAGAGGIDTTAVAQALRADLPASDCLLVALVEDHARVAVLERSGCDAVLVKPVPFFAVERLLDVLPPARVSTAHSTSIIYAQHRS